MYVAGFLAVVEAICVLYLVTCFIAPQSPHFLCVGTRVMRGGAATEQQQQPSYDYSRLCHD